MKQRLQAVKRFFTNRGWLSVFGCQFLVVGCRIYGWISPALRSSNQQPTTNNQQPRKLILSLVFLVLIFSRFWNIETVYGVAENYWTNTDTSGNFTNGQMWSLNKLGLQGQTNLHFTNNANYTVNFTASPNKTPQVYYDALGGTVTNAIANQTWTVTGNVFVANAAGATATVYHSGGFLSISNADTANAVASLQLGIGADSKATYILAGGTNKVESLRVGNGSSANTMIVSNGAMLIIADLESGANVDQTYIGAAGGQSNNIFLAHGSGTIVTAATASKYLYVYDGINSKVIITNGAKVFMTGDGDIGSLSSATNGQMIVDGSGSRFSTLAAGNIIVGNAGYSNSLTIANGATMDSVAGTIGNSVGSEYNQVIVKDSGSVWTNTGALIVGNAGANNSLLITNGGQVFAPAIAYIGAAATATNNSAIVTGSGSMLSVISSPLVVGDLGKSNTLMISDGALVKVLGGGGIALGNQADSDYNKIIITGNGSVLTNDLYMYIGNTSDNNSLIITNGGKYFASDGGGINMGEGPATNNSIIVTGSGSRLSLFGALDYMYLGTSSLSNSITVANGASMDVALSTYIGHQANGNANSLTIKDSGSIYSNDVMSVGESGHRNQLIVTNGGTLYSRDLQISTLGRSSNSTVVITDSGSIIQLSGIAYVGSNSTVTAGIGSHLMITNGGILESTGIVTGFKRQGLLSSVSNFMSTFQFTDNNPFIKTNQANSIILTNGILSYRNVTNANIFHFGANSVSNISFRGNNTFQLNAASNRGVLSYTFSNNNGGFYQNLNLINGGTYWTSSVLNIGQGGIMLISNTTAKIAGLVSNSLGSINLANSGTVTFQNELRLNGSGSNSLGAINNLVGVNSITGSVVLIGNSRIGTEGGTLTFLSTITNGGFILTTTNSASTTLIFSNTISGTGGLTVTGPGITSLAGTNTMSGNVLIDSGTIRVDGAGALSAVTNVTLSANGTLLLNTNNAIHNDASLTLAGGTLNVNDFNETVSNLTLSAYSTIVMGNNDSTTQDLIFYSNTVYTAGDIVINNWVGTAGVGADLNKDRIKFIGTPSSALLGHIWFGYGQSAMYLAGSQEIVPIVVPEPGTILSGLMVLSLLASRKRWKKQPKVES